MKIRAKQGTNENTVTPLTLIAFLLAAVSTLAVILYLETRSRSSLEESSRLSQFAIDRTGEATYWTNEEGRLLYANEAASRSLGYSHSELKGMDVFGIAPEITRALWKQLWKEIQQRGTFAFEISFRAKDGRVFPVEITVDHFAFRGRDYTCIFAHDINEKKRLQQLRDEFVSMVSHELRTPTTIIREGVAQVLEGLRGTISEDQRRTLSIALTGVDRLTRIINDLLDISKIEAGKIALRKEVVDLGALIDEIKRGFAARARERGLELRTRIPSERLDVYVDRDRMIQVFSNLVGNALKFTASGYVEIVAQDKQGIIECRVTDSGQGIAADDLPKVFTKFQQFGHEAAGGEKGSGLGLSISKGIVEMHQGKIGVESTLGKGTTFLFTLPRATRHSVFRDQVIESFNGAFKHGMPLSIIHCSLNSVGSGQNDGGNTKSAILVGDLEKLIKTQICRRTDITLNNTDQILMILPSTGKREAIQVAGRVQKTLADRLSTDPVGRTLQTTFRVTNFPDDARSEEEFLDRVLT